MQYIKTEILLTEEIKSKFLLFLNNKFSHYEKIEDFRFFTYHFHNEYSVNSFREERFLLLSKMDDNMQNDKSLEKKVFICSAYKGITFIGKIYFLKKDGLWISSSYHP